MRAMTTQEEVLMNSTERTVRLKVEVKDTGGTWRDLSDLDGVCYVIGAEWGETLDEPGLTANIEMFWHRFDDNMSFVITGARFSGYVGLNQEVRIYTATIPDADSMTPEWRQMFHGVIQDIDLTDNKGKAKITARDKIVDLLMYRWNEADTTYGSSGGTNLETVMQNILTAVLVGDAPTLYVPTSPGFAIVEYDLEPKSLMEAMRQLFLLIGWDCRPKWRSGTGQFELTLYDPDRTNTTAAWTFSADQYRTFDSFGVGVEHIRNVIDVWYYDGSTASGTDKQLSKYQASDATSITAYGRRWMELTEDPAKGINTAGEAQTLAESILSDLKDPEATFGIQVGYFPFAELNDLFAFEPENQRFTSQQKLATYAYRHAVSASGFAATYLTCTGKPKSGMAVWTARQAGVAVPAHDTSTPPTPTNTTTSGPLGMLIETGWPKAGDYDTVEFHKSSTASFTPSASTLAQSGRELAFYDSASDRGTKYYKVIIKDKSGNQSTASSETSGAASGISRSLMSDEMQRGVRVRPTSDQTGETVTGFTVEFDDVVWGYSSMFSDGADAIESQGEIIYMASAHIVPGSTEATTWAVRLVSDTNGTVYTSATVSGDVALSFVVPHECTTSETFTLEIDFTGGTVDIESTGTFFSMIPTTIAP